MRTPRTKMTRFNRAATAALLLAAFVAAIPGAVEPASAQVKEWKEIKFPTLRPFTIPEPERFVMKNGLVVMLMEDHELPLIQVFARVRTGSRLEPAEKTGLAAMTGAVLRTGGAKGRSGDDIDDFLDARGARIETSIGIDSGSATISSLKGDFPEVFQVFADILRSPDFDESKLKVSKTQAMAGIARRNDDPMGIMRREGSRLVYGADSPYGRNTEYATIESITQVDLKAFHAKYYMPNRIILGLTGDFDPKEMKALLERLFGDWPKGPEAADLEASYQKAPKPGIYHVHKTDMTQSDITMAHLGIRRDNPDYFAASVMNEAFSGSFAARLFSHIRTDKGLAYSVRGGLDSEFDYPGLFNAWMTTKTETTAASIEALLQEVDDLVNKPPTAEEVARAKSSILNSFIFNSQSIAQILNQQLTYEYFGYPRDFLARYRENVEKVTPADVARVAKTYVKKSDLAILVVGKSEGLDKPLETFGKVATLDITIPEPGMKGTAVASAPGMSEKESAAKGAEIVRKIVASLGGAEKIDGVKNLRITTQMTMSTGRGDMQVRATSLFIPPDRIRQEMVTQMGTMTMVVTPAEAFMNTPRGIQPLPDSRRAELVKSMSREPLLLFQKRADPGFSAMYSGTEEIASAKADVVAVALQGETVRFSVETATGRVLRVSYKGTGPGGVPGERTSIYSDYRDVSGVMLPWKTEILFNGEPAGSVIVEDLAVNVTVDDAAFAKPAAAGAAAPSGGR